MEYLEVSNTLKDVIDEAGGEARTRIVAVVQQDAKGDSRLLLDDGRIVEIDGNVGFDDLARIVTEAIFLHFDGLLPPKDPSLPGPPSGV